MVDVTRVDVAGEEVELLPERAVHWGTTVLVADLHWGKGETFRGMGLPVPGGELEDDLARLDTVLARTAARRLVVLGDLVHGRAFATVEDAVARWRASRPVSIVLVRGNHDRHQPSLPASWEIEAVDGPLRDGPFLYSHYPEPVAGSYTWCGHLHPTVTLSGKADRMRLPCFHLGSRVGVLPAFGTFTGGVRVKREGGDRVFAIAGGRVVEV